MFRPVARIIEKGKLLTGRPAEEVRKLQLAAMHEATLLTTRLVKERTPQGVSGAEGGLISTIQPEVRESQRGVIGTVGTASPYGMVIEKGRRPNKGRPPYDAIEPWVQLRFGVEGDELQRITEAVRWKIAKKGTKGAAMFEKTLDEDWPDIKAIFERYGVTIARELEQ